MEYTNLGNSGLIVSRLAFGAMTFSSGNRDIPAIFNVGAETADALVGQALDAGINFFDTADIYAGGQSEEILGKAIGKRRDQVILSTKVGGVGFHGINDAGLSRRHILGSVDRSLKRLGTDWIDLYVIHRDDPTTPMEETLLALDTVVRHGKVRYLGFSNWTAWRAAKAMETMRANGLAQFTHGQMYYSLAGRDIEADVIPMMREYGLGLTVWSPLAGGLLTGKYKEAGGGEDGRVTHFDMLPVDRGHLAAILDVMRPIAEAHGASLAQIAIAWLLAMPVVSSVTLGAAKQHQLADTLKAASIKLSSEECAALEVVSARPKPYPSWFNERFADQRPIRPKL